MCDANISPFRVVCDMLPGDYEGTKSPCGDWEGPPPNPLRVGGGRGVGRRLGRRQMNVRYIMLVLFLLAATCCGAAELSVNCMLVGEQVLEVSDTRQLTLKADGEVTETLVSPDGKYVVYLAKKPDATECRLAKISTDKTVTLLSAMQPDGESSGRSEWWDLGGIFRVAWSPDSSMFAFGATRRAWEEGQQSEQYNILFYSAAGAFKKALLVPDDVFGLMFTPDCRKVVANLLIRGVPNSDGVSIVQPTTRLIDIATGKVRDVYESKTSTPVLLGWSEDGALLVNTHDRRGELHKIPLQGGSSSVLADRSLSEAWSPDGCFTALSGGGISVWDRLKNETVKITDDSSVYLARWASNSRMLLYSKSESITAPSKSRERSFRSLWLSTLQPGKLNQLCVAQDAGYAVSCSRDCRKIAYISQGQLYIAELTLREPTVSEKLVTGIPLTEEEMKRTLLSNGKQISIALKMYCDDHDGKLPPADSVAKAIYNNLRDGDVFFRPGTDASIFKYIDPGVEKYSDIRNESDTIIGELDAGYGWKVLIFADTHSETKEKQ